MTEVRQQRRLTTIFAADVFGYSRIMAENEEEALRTLKAHRAVIDRLIARHDGRIFNTAGDSVIAEFGSATEAVRCAITIQEELRARNSQIDSKRRMEFRVGINVGDVMVDGDNLYGDGVNIAARLESIAPPGNICISGSVFALVKNKLSYGFEDIGLQAMKNIPEPVPVFRLTPNLHPPRVWTFKKRLAVFGGTALFIFLFVGAVSWMILWPSFFDRGRLGESAAKREPSVPTNAQTRLFDGLWEFKLAGGPYCPIKSLIFQRKILDGIVVSNEGRKLGSINKEGKFRFSNPSPTNPNIIVESQGSIDGETGQGSYAGAGTPCQGTYQIRLVQRLGRSQ